MTSRALFDLMPDYETWGGTPRCVDADPAMFFPQIGANDQAAAAKAICQTCPVIDPCREWALDQDERFGVWGGLSERERARMLGRRRTHRAAA